MVRVKICCISSLVEAETALRHGADAIGLVSWMPSGPGIIDDAMIRSLASQVKGARRFLLTCKTNPGEIAEQVRAAGTDTVQLTDRMSPDDLTALRGRLPDVSIVQVVHVLGDDSIVEAEQVADYVDEILLDSGNPDAAARTLGGTGLAHDWELSAEIVRRVGCPVFLAGGLGPDNVAVAIRRVRPYGVDVCSGLRPEDKLDEALLSKFFAEVKSAA
jgi:phosphoribosylanthranilate isomerase